MDPELTRYMFTLVNTFATKGSFKGPELTSYLKGLTFTENYFQLMNLILEGELRRLEDEESKRDPTRTVK